MSDRTLVHVSRLGIRWADMDELGHVNNAVYFTYMENARLDWLREIGCAPDPQGEGPVVVNASCTFMKQLKYPGDVEVRMLVGEIGRSSIQTWQEIRRVDQPSVLCAQGAAKVVWVNYLLERSQPLSEAQRARIMQPTQSVLDIGKAGAA
ncbi:acyl-CoA thioesterase [Lacisediminimonas profundi]|uniref:acyl-CoA thioesterase n=1 Tax=Lacisediminimonas profundi TaxID=2603856 RepID=UPI00124B4022|nr:thioesterase family protein [Lacisediminimonas profundi]